MFLRCSVVILLLLGIGFVLPACVFADGGVYTRIGVLSEVSIPGQEALVIFDGTEETLVLRIQFRGEGDDFAWIVPVPNLPEVGTAAPELFSFLEMLSRPKVVTSASGIFRIAPLLLFFLLLFFVGMLMNARMGPLLATITVVGFVFLIAYPNFMSMRGRGGTLLSEGGVTVHETDTIGPYEIAVLSSIDPLALVTWFKKNGYALPEDAIPVFDDYVRKNWYFVASRLSSGITGEIPDWETTPLKICFATGKAVYPMRLTSLAAGKSGVLLYVLGKEFYRAKGFKVENTRNIAEHLRGSLKKKCKMEFDAFPSLCLTRLYGSLSPARMNEDVVIVQSGREKEFRSTVYTHKARVYTLAITLICFIFVWAFLLLPVRFWKKFPFAYLAFAMIVLVRPWVLSASFSRQYEEVRVRLASTSRNMYAVQHALEKFSTMTEGYYPADINTTVRELRRQLGSKSDNDTSVAGAKGSDPVLQGEIGSTGPALLSKNIRNPYSSDIPAVHVLETSRMDPPAFSVPGLVYYVPLDIEGNVATGYKIYGATQERLQRLVLSESKRRARLKPFEMDDKWGYTGWRNRVVIRPQFDEADKFSEKLAAVKTGGKWGYIDKEGKFVIRPQFDEADRFFEGLAAVKIGGKWGYIDKEGDLVIKPQFDDADRFSDQLAAVKLGEMWGYIDETGKVVIRPLFDSAGRFSRGRAIVRIGGKSGEVDRTGKLMGELEKVY